MEAVLFLGWRLVEDLSLLQGDLESKAFGSLCKAGNSVLQDSFSVDEGGRTKVGSSAKRSRSSCSNVFVSS